MPVDRPIVALPGLGLGCNALGHIDASAAHALVAAALDAGVTVFDTAPAYASGESERTLGRSLPADRSRLFVVTKFGHPASYTDGRPNAPANLIRSVEDSLTRLRCARIDCLVVHFPDPATPIEETLAALRDLVAAGKIAHYGVSNFAPGQLATLLDRADALVMPPPAIVQEDYSLLHRRKAEALLPILARRDIALTPFFPLASGLLTGKLRDAADASPLRRTIVRSFEARFLDADTLARLDRVAAICAREDVAMTALALRWLATRPHVGVIAAGATSADQVRANLAAWHAAVPPSAIAAADTV